MADISTLQEALTTGIEYTIDLGNAHDPSGMSFEDGPVRVTIQDGLLVPIHVRAGTINAPAGWTFVGHAHAEVRFPTIHDARRFANRLVFTLDYSRERLAATAVGGPWSTEVDRAIFFSPLLAADPAFTGRPPPGGRRYRARGRRVSGAPGGPG